MYDKIHYKLKKKEKKIKLRFLKTTTKKKKNTANVSWVIFMMGRQ